MAKTTWTLDPTHSELGFKIKHLMITNVSGLFKAFQIEAETEGDDFTTASVRATADMTSISTSNDQRDAHLRNADFFETDRFPELQFQSTRIEKAGDESFHLFGDLTIKGVTRPVKLHVENSGIAKDPWGNQRAGFVVTGKINRTEWGVNFNSTLETGGLLLGEEVRINSEVQLIKQVAVPA